MQNVKKKHEVYEIVHRKIPTWLKIRPMGHNNENDYESIMIE